MKEEFINNYVATFLASYSAATYDENCMGGWERSPKPPVEDAYYLAKEAWEALKKHKEDQKL
jgi:hypothetical protein